MGGLVVLGNLSRDATSGGPRAGGAAVHAARAVGGRARIVARGAAADRGLVEGLPVEWLEGERTAAFAYAYEGDRRTMTVEALGDRWSPEEAVAAAGDADWVHVGALARSDFPPETLAALASRARVLLDGQGLVRPARTGPLVLDGEFDPEALRHVTALKLAEEEAAAAGPVDVPELLVTFGSRGFRLLAGGEETVLPAQPAVAADPTGAGDVFCAAYALARSGGQAPPEAALDAARTVARVLAG